MTIGYTDITLNSELLNITSLTKRKVPFTYKQKVGGKVVRHTIPGTVTREYEIDCRGIIIDSAGTAATTARTALEALDDLGIKNYSDGLITASVYIESLEFDDDSNNPLHYTYSLKLIEINQ